MENIGNIHDFDRIRTARITRKNSSVIYVFLIFLIISFSLFLTFLIIYLAGAPMEISGVIMYKGETGYERFFIMYLSFVGGSIILEAIIIIWQTLTRAKPFAWLGTDSEMDEILYVRDRNREALITKDVLIILFKRSGTIQKITDPASIKEALNLVLFWHRLESEKPQRMKRDKNKLVLSFKNKRRAYWETRTYTVLFDQSGAPVKYREAIGYSSGGGQRNNSFKTYHLEDVNRGVSLPIDPRIRKNMTF